MESRKVIKVFIGSPGDVKKERELFHDIIGAVNRLKAKSMEIQLEPVGWEDTLPGKGRPQGLINEDVEQSDLVVLLLWKRWGTPTGEYTSGFEEEYELAKSLNEKTNGKPEIWLYFRAVPEDMLADVGPQLRRVQAFKEKIEKEREFLYRVYEDEMQWKKMLREHLCRWLDNLYIIQEKLDRDEKIPLGSPSLEVEVKDPVAFLSYSRVDEQTANRLKSDLTKRGINIWIDKEQMLPGERWKEKVSDAIKSCEFAIICLSNKALSKEGYFHKELSEIKERDKLFPGTKIFIIPVRLDKCDIPDELHEIQTADLFENWESGIKSITKSILKNSSTVALQQQMTETLGFKVLKLAIEIMQGI